MVCLRLLFLIVGIGYAFTENGDSTQNCITREEFETRLLELTETHFEDAKVIRQLKEANEKLEKRVENLENELGDIRAADTDNKYEVALENHAIVSELENNELENSSLKKAMYAGGKLDESYDRTEKQNKLVRPKIKNVIRKQRFIVTDEASPVAFSVVIQTSDLTGLGQGQIIKFDKNLTNLGNSFDMRLGVFTAPVSGFYVFSLTLMGLPNETQALYVMKDGSFVFTTWATGSFHNSVSRTVVIQVNKGEEIWVETAGVQGASHNVHGYEHTSFTGFLIYAIDA